MLTFVHKKFGRLMFSVFRGHGVKKVSMGHWSDSCRGSTNKDNQMYGNKEQTKSRYSSLNSMFVSL